MRKSASENTFISFIKKNKTALILILIILIGILLLCLPSNKLSGGESEEKRLAELCSAIDGVGECSVLLNMKDGEVVSVAILCEGADSSEVEADIKELVSSLYGIGYNKVTVLKLSE